MKDITYTIVSNGNRYRLRDPNTGAFAERPYHPYAMQSAPMVRELEFDSYEAANTWRKQNEWREVP